MKVVIMEHTTDPLNTIYRAVRQCYMPGWSGRHLVSKSRESKVRLIQKVLSSGHTSTLEHVSFTFAIAGVSRSLTHQLVRHRIASFSQQSQRYVKETDPDFIMPNSIERSYKTYHLFEHTMKIAWDIYQKLIQEGVPPEDARYVLPNAAETKIVVTMNCRSLLNFFELRCCKRAQWEIRKLAWKMLILVNEILPEVFIKAGPKCSRLGYCPEDEQFSCGAMKGSRVLIGKKIQETANE